MIDPMAAIGRPPEHRDYLSEPSFYPEIDSTARVEAFVTVDSGTTRPTVVGARTWLMKHVHVAHDCIVGEDCELSPHAGVMGWAEIGNGVRIGAGAMIRNRVKVGDGARIGMGAVVVKDVPAGETWVGNPARPIEKDPWEQWAEQRFGAVA